MKYCKAGKQGVALTDAELEAARKEVQDEYDKIRQMNGPVNAHQLHQEMGDLMYEYVSIERDNNGLDKCLEKLKDILSQLHGREDVKEDAKEDENHE